jgi:DNA-binding NarL/FixJ family response regulator
MPKVLIVDDHIIVRQGLRTLLLEMGDGYLTGEAANGQQALEACRADSWDVVLLDISMSAQNGLDVLNILRHEYPDLPVVMLSFFLDPAKVSQCLNAGAAGYIAKEDVADVILDAIATVLDGQLYLSPAAKSACQQLQAN